MLAAPWAGADVFTGTLTVGVAGDPNDELEGTAGWGTGPTSLAYTVSQNADQTWHYEYQFSVPESSNAISHFIIELTDGAKDADFTYDTASGVNTWDVALYETHEPTGGNPNMPESVYGVKWEWDQTEGGYNETFSFDSIRAPVWQDFYAKCGGANVNTIWNTGFTTDDVDPTDPYTSTSVTDHILAPNGRVPEPATTALFGLGLASLVGARFRRRKDED
jgi:hypothetical protein